MIIDYLETRNSTQSHGFSLFNNVFVKSNVTLNQKTKKKKEFDSGLSFHSYLIYISRFQLAAEENSTDNFLLVFVFLSEDSDSWATDAEFLLLLKLQFKCLLTLQCALVFLLLSPCKCVSALSWKHLTQRRSDWLATCPKLILPVRNPLERTLWQYCFPFGKYLQFNNQLVWRRWFPHVAVRDSIVLYCTMLRRRERCHYRIPTQHNTTNMTSNIFHIGSKLPTCKEFSLKCNFVHHIVGKRTFYDTFVNTFKSLTAFFAFNFELFRYL